MDTLSHTSLQISNPNNARLVIATHATTPKHT
jgi:hypothetical protein